MLFGVVVVADVVVAVVVVGGGGGGGRCGGVNVGVGAGVVDVGLMLLSMLSFMLFYRLSFMLL